MCAELEAYETHQYGQYKTRTADFGQRTGYTTGTEV